MLQCNLHSISELVKDELEEAGLMDYQLRMLLMLATLLLVLEEISKALPP